MKKLISFVMVIAVMLSLAMLPANAALPPVGVIGDIDGNWTVDILDATALQNTLVGNVDECDNYFVIADTNGNGVVDVMDATEIQRYVAELPCSEYIDEDISCDMHTNDFYSDYESGSAMAGVPVTFTCSVYSGSPVIRYELFVDGQLVASDRENNSLTYTFPEPGEYDIEMVAVAALETGIFEHENFKVVAPYGCDQPVVTSMYVTGTRQWGDICFDTDGYYYHANVIGGEGPYTYTFTLEIPSAFSGSDIICYRYENIAENYIELPEVRYSSLVKDGEYNTFLKCKVTVRVTDAKGNVTTKSEDFYYSMMRLG